MAVTIKDVAREARVSVASVSRALNGSANVTEITRRRIIGVAERLRYVPHSAARSHLEPLRVLPERRLPADSSLPGHIAAHDARWRAVGNALMSPPVSAMITSAGAIVRAPALRV